MSLKIYLLRHGETDYSQRGAFCGDLDINLTPEGKQMAHSFADAYRSIPWTDIYVSPMKRAIATAQPLCDALDLSMQMRDGLKEISYGAWEDQELETVRQHYEEDYIRWQTDPAYRGREESFQTLLSLRTVQAVLPHTALQLIVSSSGSARFRMGFNHCEKSQAREVGVCPLLMVLDISTRSPSLLLILPQNTS